LKIIRAAALISKALQREHAAICEAIMEGDAEAAREAMRQHLGNRQARHRLLAAEAAAAQQHGTPAECENTVLLN
jgi:DNA-binding FadR family transcriptional regulator